MKSYLNHLRCRFVGKTILVLSVFTLAGCEVGSQTKAKVPFRAPVAGNSGVSSGNVSAEVGTPVSVSVTVKDKNGFGIQNVIPSVTALDSSGSSVGITAGGCGITNTKGTSVCTLQSSKKNLYTVHVVSPVQLVGGTIDFFQVPRTLSFSTQPASTAVSQTTSITPQVKVLDRAGVAMPNAGTVSIAIGTGTGTLTGTKNITVDGTGVAAFTDLKLDKVGSYTLVASLSDTVAGTIQATSSAIAITAGVATLLSFSTNPTSSVATGEVFTQQPIVSQTDAAGNAVAGDNSCVVTLQLTGGEVGDTLLGSTLAMTMINGVADFKGQSLRVNRIGTTTGPITNYQLRAVPSGSCAPLVAGGPYLSQPFTVTLAGLPAQMALVQAPSTAALNETWANQPIVSILDVNGAAVTSDNTTRVIMSVNAVTTPPLGTLVGSTSVAVASGRATFSGLRILGSSSDKAKTYTYTFHGVHPGLTISPDLTTTQVITANGLIPAALQFSVQPANEAVKQSMPPIQVKVVDAQGFFCFNDNASQIRIAYDGTVIDNTANGNMRQGSGTLATLPSVTAFGVTYKGVTAAQTVVNGIATISNLNFPDTGAKMIRASFAGNLTGDANDTGHVLSDVFAINDHDTVADHLKFSQEPQDCETPANNCGVSDLGPWRTQPIVDVRDKFDNLMTDDNTTQITISCIAPLACSTTLTGDNLTVTAVNGRAFFSGLRTGANQDGIVIKATSNPAMPTGSAQSAPTFLER